MKGQTGDPILPDKFIFLFGAEHSLRTIQCLYHPLTYFWNTFRYFFAQTEDINGITHSVYQMFRPYVPDTGHHCQSDAIYLFLFVIGHFRYGAKTLSNNSLLLKRPFTTHTVSTVDFTTTLLSFLRKIS